MFGRDKSQRNPQDSRLEARLDAALAETFPASDPIAVGQPTATEPLRPLRRHTKSAGVAAPPRSRPGRRARYGAKVRGP
jgi:hypothetical protein